MQAGIPVFSNAKNHRHDPLVPLVVPTANLSHLDLLHAQRSTMSASLIEQNPKPENDEASRKSTGMLVCNSNCSVVGIAVPFAALEATFGKGCIATASVTTLQAVSGGGYPGVASMDVVDNIVPFISGEEGKIFSEARKILGSVSVDGAGIACIQSSEVSISATCTRVPVLDGHTAIVSVRFAQRPPPAIAAVKEALAGYISEAQSIGCPSAPKRAIVVMEEQDRPQPRLDRDIEGGYAVSIGRLREDISGVWDAMFVSLSHNSKEPHPRFMKLRADNTISHSWSCWSFNTECGGGYTKGFLVGGGMYLKRRTRENEFRSEAVIYCAMRYW